MSLNTTPEARPVCSACNTAHPRLPMDELTAAAYDAIFPHALQWSEDEDCGMNTLMRDVAQAAAAGVRAAMEAQQ